MYQILQINLLLTVSQERSADLNFIQTPHTPDNMAL